MTKNPTFQHTRYLFNTQIKVFKHILNFQHVLVSLKPIDINYSPVCFTEYENP